MYISRENDMNINLCCLIMCRESESKINHHNDIPAALEVIPPYLPCTKGRQVGYFRDHSFIPIHRGKTKGFLSVHKDLGLSLETG